ncbi:MAG: M20/M25/M40 family metallo-hydrolase [Hellea sp.]
MFKKWGLLLLTLLISIVFAIMAVTPPAPKDLDTPADQFSSARAMKDVAIIAAKPHPTGSLENEIVRDYLSDRLKALGMEVSLSESYLGERALKRLNKWSGEAKTEQIIFNVIGVLPGEDRLKPAVLLMAHHDTVWGSPGAADDTVGIASILEIVGNLKQAGTQKRDLIILFTDGEEVGLSGARDFFKNHPLRDKIGAVINFEARGGGGTVNMFQTSAENGNVAKLYARTVKQPSASSLSTYVYNVLPNDTDLTPALERDYAAYNIANLGDAKYYHSPKIDAHALDEKTLQHMGSQGLDLTRALLSADDLPAKKPDATFFDVFGMFTLIYAPFWGWIFLAFAAILGALSVKRKLNRKEIISGCLKMLGFLLIGGALLSGLNSLSGGGRGANYYDRLAAIPKLEWLALFLCLAVFFAIFGRKASSGNTQLGAAIPLFLLALLGQFFAPTAAYFLTLPLFLRAAASFAVQRWPDGQISAVMAAALTALVVGYMLSLEHLLMLGVGPDMLAVAIMPAAIAALAILPLYAGLSKRGANSLAISGLAVSIGLALWIRLDPIASTVPLY